MQYIMWRRKNGGWFTRSASTHSDWKEAHVYTAEQAEDVIRLHEGNLLPVDLDLYKKGLGLDKR